MNFWTISLCLSGFGIGLLLMNYTTRPHDGVLRNYKLVTDAHDKTRYTFFLDIHEDTVIKAKASEKAETIDSCAIAGALKKIVNVQKEELTYNLNPKLLTYSLIFAIMLATAFGLLLPIINLINKLTKAFEVDSKERWLLSLLVVPSLLIIVLRL